MMPGPITYKTRAEYVAHWGEENCRQKEQAYPHECPWLTIDGDVYLYTGTKVTDEGVKVADDTGIKDSGARRQFETGAMRDRGVGDIKKFRRYDLLPVHALHRLACHYGKGAAKYLARNWEKGMPLSEYHNSAEAHRMKLLAGYTDEDHLMAWFWNVACFVETKERIKLGLLPKELDDMPTTCASLTPDF